MRELYGKKTGLNLLVWHTQCLPVIHVRSNMRVYDTHNACLCFTYAPICMCMTHTMRVCVSHTFQNMHVHDTHNVCLCFTYAPEYACAWHTQCVSVIHIRSRICMCMTHKMRVCASRTFQNMHVHDTHNACLWFTYVPEYACAWHTQCVSVFHVRSRICVCMTHTMRVSVIHIRSNMRVHDTNHACLCFTHVPQYACSWHTQCVSVFHIRSNTLYQSSVCACTWTHTRQYVWIRMYQSRTMCINLTHAHVLEHIRSNIYIDTYVSI
jgi:hypothetical protein